jgi:glyoxylase-like metal-dependent hydrolase (beta-lactamase superfamily II)
MKKKILIAVAVIVLIPVAAVGALFTMREPPDGPRVEARPGIVGVEAGGAYAWIVQTPTGAVLVDGGLDATGAAILTELRGEGVQPDQVRAVLVTHGHPDHYAAARLFDKAAIVAGAADVPMMHGDKTHYGTFGRIMSAVVPLPPAPTVTTEVRGGEQLMFDGARFTVVATPGHSPGSVMYLYDDVLFTGDSLMRKNGGVAIAPALFSEDANRNRASLAALQPLAFHTVADGHAGVTRDAKEKLARFLAGS